MIGFDISNDRAEVISVIALSLHNLKINFCQFRFHFMCECTETRVRSCHRVKVPVTAVPHYQVIFTHAIALTVVTKTTVSRLQLVGRDVPKPFVMSVEDSDFLYDG